MVLRTSKSCSPGISHFMAPKALGAKFYKQPNMSRLDVSQTYPAPATTAKTTWAMRHMQCAVNMDIHYQRLHNQRDFGSNRPQISGSWNAKTAF